ncbi:MAG TPA: outer membrane protein assembly factor BamE [Steroidobacteraceae bacterium]|nr:outer membrane protein assembly factor BamE [Steroidobacteraceae bacterium]
MNKKIALLVLAGLFGASPSFAEMNDLDKGYVDQLIKGGWSTLRQVSENMVNTSYSNTEVLDVLSEVLLEKYPQAATDFSTVDSAAWMCRALGASRNTRYRGILEKIENDKTVHRKLRAHCEKAAKNLPKGSDNAYVAGTVNLELLRNPPPPPPPPAPPAAAAKGKKNAKNAKPAAEPATAPAPAPAAAAPAAAATPGTVDLTKIQVGMSQQQVNDLLGPPTAQTQRQTGKQWQPFNYGARDLQRMMYHYKGVGRVEFSLKSAYEGVFRVIAVTPDANETGYP